jgi:hypothetical protein
MATESVVPAAITKQSSNTQSVTPDPAINMLPETVADLDLRSTPQTPQLGIKKWQTSESCAGLDSGYTSQATTPEGLMPESSQNSFSQAVAINSRKLFTRKVKSLKPFDKEIPEATQNRFYDLKELFGEPLYRYLTQHQPDVRLNSISIKLMVLGENEASAKPWVVVLCDATISQRVKKYFNQHGVREQFQSSDADSDLPTLDLVVCKKPPRRIAATEDMDIYGDCWDENGSYITLCGTTIKADGPGKNRLAKVGGVIKVTSFGGHSSLYAMTVGHIVQQGHAEEDMPDMEISSDEDKARYGNESEDEEDFFLGGGEEYVVDLAGREAYEMKPPLVPNEFHSPPENSNGPPRQSQRGLSPKRQFGVLLQNRDQTSSQTEYRDTLRDHNDPRIGSWNHAASKEQFEVISEARFQPRLLSPRGMAAKKTPPIPQPSVSWSKMGHISVSSHHSQGEKSSLDWALIKIDDHSRYRPNLFRIPNKSRAVALTEPLPQLTRPKSKTRVAVLNGKNGHGRQGKLSILSSFLLLAPGNSLIETHTLAMDHGSGES